MTGKILKRLWAAAREQNLDSDTLHSRVYAEFGKDSIRDLTDVQALYIIDVIQGRKANRPPAPGMATQKQKWMVQKLAQELGWEDNPARLAGFIKKYTGSDSIEWITLWQASNVINGMKSLLERTKNESERNGRL